MRCGRLTPSTGARFSRLSSNSPRRYTAQPGLSDPDLSPRRSRPVTSRLFVLLVCLSATSLSGCAVASVAGAAVSVAGAAVGATVAVAGTAVDVAAAGVKAGARAVGTVVGSD